MKKPSRYRVAFINLHIVVLFPCISENRQRHFVFFFSCDQSAEKQGNQLHMNVYKMKGQACGGPLKTEVKELKGDLRPAPPYPSRVKTVDKGTQVTPEREAVRKQAHSPVSLILFCISILPCLVRLVLISFNRFSPRNQMVNSCLAVPWLAPVI